jgi:ribonuclease HII
MVTICGIDEAGRGPVLGPMVLAGVVISEDRLPELVKLGVKDSKLIAPKKREELYKKIIDLVDNYTIIEVSPNQIDQKNESGTNLNQLEAIKIAQILNKLKPDKAILDSPEPTAAKFGVMVNKLLNGQDIEIISEHKADMNYPVCSAASILAKVARDRSIKKIEQEIGYKIGSGYPADPNTKHFLQNHYSDDKHIQYIRTCWSTYQKLNGTKLQSNLKNW